MKDFFLARAMGLVMIVAGILLTAAIIWLASVIHFFPLKLTIIGPVLISAGVGVVVFGDFILGNQGKLATVLGWMFLIPGLAAGYWLADGLHTGHLRFLEIAGPTVAQQSPNDASGRESVTVPSASDIHNRMIPRPELDAIVAEVNAKAAELKLAQASLNTKDSAAVERFNKDVAAYTQRNHQAAALRAEFELQQRMAGRTP